MTTNFNELRSFSNEFKRLKKKYRSLSDDLEEFKRVIEVFPLGTGKHFDIITRNEKCVVIKARLFCRYLKGSSLRIIYSYREIDALIDFIEIYFKGEKENEDRERINEYLKDLRSRRLL